MFTIELHNGNRWAPFVSNIMTRERAERILADLLKEMIFSPNNWRITNTNHA